MKSQPFALALLAGLVACAPTPRQADLTIDPGSEMAPVPAKVAPPRPSGLELAGFDTSIHPSDDLYLYAGGKWLRETPIPVDRSNWGTFEILDSTSEQQQRAIAERLLAGGPWPAGSDEQKVADFYASFMDTARLEALGIAPIGPALERIAAIGTSKELIAHLGAARTGLQRSPLFFYVSQDPGDARRYVGAITQGGLSMPDRDYYLKPDATNKAFRAQHLAYVERLFTLAGFDDAASRAVHVAGLEKAIAEAQWTKVQNRDPVATYNLKGTAELAKLSADIDWTAYMKGLGASVAELNVRQPTYVQKLGRLVHEVPIAAWQDYFRFQLLDVSAPWLGPKFEQAEFEFRSKALQGVEQQPERWKRGVGMLDEQVGEIVGRIYVAEHFPAESKARMNELVANVLAAFDSSIDTLAWMGPETRAQAKQKLSKITVKVGYPDVWQDYSALQVSRDDLYGNLLRTARYELDRDIAKLGQPIDRNEWAMTPQTVNAYYSPLKNEIVFPAAILQAPFFDPANDDAVNYGAIGGVIGHEISHGFDDSGRQYDGDGNLRDWWTAEDAVRFKALADRLVTQYDGYTVLDGQHLNGRLTLGENIGDLSGLAVALRAYHLSLHGKEGPVIDGYSADQRFFLGWAQGWRRSYRENNLRMRLVADPHSPSEFRVNGVVPNMEAFYQAFDVQPGDALFREPADRVTIW